MKPPAWLYQLCKALPPPKNALLAFQPFIRLMPLVGSLPWLINCSILIFTGHFTLSIVLFCFLPLSSVFQTRIYNLHDDTVIHQNPRDHLRTSESGDAQVCRVECRIAHSLCCTPPLLPASASWTEGSVPLECHKNWMWSCGNFGKSKKFLSTQ